MDFDQTQIIALDEFEDETDEEISQSQKAPVAHLKVPCQKGVPEELYPLYEGNNVIGRQEDCNIYIPSKALSKQHACIEIRGDSHLIYDSGSRNKTRRGKLFLSPNVRYELKHHDSIIFADVHTSYSIVKELSRVEDSGSETGSESMLQTVQIEGEEATVLDETVEGDESDASSDILQPTQPSSSAATWKSNRMMEATQKFGSDGSDDQFNGKMSIAETPAARRDQSAELSTLVLPESGSESDSMLEKGNPQATLVFEEEKDTSGDQDLLAAPTQACFSTNSDTEEEEEEESKKELLCAATQAYDLAECEDDTEEGKMDLTESTLAVVEESQSDQEDCVDIAAPTQMVAVDEDSEEPKTVAYDMDVVGRKKRKGNSRTPTPEPTCAPTQAYTLNTEDAPRKKAKTSPKPTDQTVAYTLDTEDAPRKKSKTSANPTDPTLAYDLESEISSKEPEKDPEKQLKPGTTQSFNVQDLKAGDKSSDSEDRGLVPTQVFEDEDEGEEDEDNADVSHLLATSTLACDMEEEEEESDSDLPAVLEEDKHVMELETQAVGNDDATQAFDEEEEVVTKKTGKKGNEEDATQVFADDGTVPVSAISPKKANDDDATQVFDEDSTLVDREVSRKASKGRRAENDDATQVFDDATLAVNEPSAKKTKGAKSRKAAKEDDATLEIDENPTLPTSGDGDAEEDDATQVFEDATVAIEEPETEGNNDATQVIDTDATQVFGNDDPTLAVTDDTASTEEPTQVFGVDDPTLEVEDKPDDSTQVIGEVDATVAVEEEDEPVRRPGRGRGRGRGRSVSRGRRTNKEVETLPVEEEVEEEEQTSKRGRGRQRKTKEDIDATMPAADLDETLEEEKQNKRSARPRGKCKPEPEDATMPMEDVGDTKPARGRGRKQEPDATVPVENIVEDKKPARKGRGRRKDPVADVEEPTDADEDAVGSGGGSGEGGQEATQVYGKESDSDSEDSTLPVDELVEMESVDSKPKTRRPKSASLLKKNKQKTPTKSLVKNSSGEGTEASDLEPTQAYGRDEPEATQMYGLDGEEMVPGSEDTERGRSPLVSIPSRSPHKSALASPKRSPSPSPKRVAFAPGVADNESKTMKSGMGRGRGRGQGRGTGRGRGRGRRSLDAALAANPEEQETSVGRRRSEPRVVDDPPGRSRGKVVDKGEPEENTNIHDDAGGEVVSKTDAMKEAVSEEEIEKAEDVKVKAPTRRGRKSVAAAIIDSKKESDVKEEEKTVKEVIKGRGRKSQVTKVEEDKVTSARRGRRSTAAPSAKSESNKSEEAPRGRGRQRSVEKVEKPEPTKITGRKGRKSDESIDAEAPVEVQKGRGRRKSPAEAEIVEAPFTKGRGSREESVESTPEVETPPEVPPRTGRGKGKKTEATKPTRESSVESAGDVESMKPPRAGRSNRMTEPAAEPTNVRSRRGRSASVDSSKSDGSLDDAKSESRARSRTRKTEEDTSLPTRKGRESGSSVEEEVKTEGSAESKVTKGKGGRTKASSSGESSLDSVHSSGSERPSRSRKRTSEESIEPPAAKKGKKTGTEPDAQEEDVPSSPRRGRRGSSKESSLSEEPESRPSKRASKRESTCMKEHENASVELPNAKRTKRGQPESEPPELAPPVKKGRGKGKADAKSEPETPEQEPEPEPKVAAKRGRGKDKSDKSHPEPAVPAKKGRGKDKPEAESEPELEVVTRKGRGKGKAEAKTEPEAETPEPEPEVVTRKGRGKGKPEAKTEPEAETPEPEPEVVTRKGRGKGKAEARTEPEAETPEPEAVTRKGRGKSKAEAKSEPEAANQPARGSRSKSEGRVETDAGGGVKRRKGGESPAQAEDSTPSKKSRLEAASPKGRQKIIKEEIASPSLRRKSMEPKPRVLFTGVVDEQGQKIVRDLGGDLASSIHDCTHLVTDKVRRTVKFLGGLARGVPIVTPHWLSHCKSASTFLDSSKFMVTDTATEKQYKFSLKKSLARAADTNLLQGYKVHVTKSVRPEPTQMKDVLVCAGAEFLATMPKKKDDNVLVMSCEDDKSVCSAAIKAGIPVVSSEFVLTGILRQEVDVSSFQLFSEDSSSKGGARSKARR